MQSLTDTKQDCILILQEMLSAHISQYFYSIYTETQNMGLKVFQRELNNISEWNNNKLKTEIDNIVEKCDCDYLSKLIKITIITSLKLKFFEYKKTLRNINIKIPTIYDFIHKILVNVSHFSWKNSYLFVQKNLKSIEIQNNMNIIDHSVKKIISKTIAEFVNVKEVILQLNEYIDMSIQKNKKLRRTKEFKIKSNQSFLEKQHVVDNIVPKKQYCENDNDICYDSDSNEYCETINEDDDLTNNIFCDKTCSNEIDNNIIKYNSDCDSNIKEDVDNINQDYNDFSDEMSQEEEINVIIENNHNNIQSEKSFADSISDTDSGSYSFSSNDEKEDNAIIEDNYAKEKDVKIVSFDNEITLRKKKFF